MLLTTGLKLIPASLLLLIAASPVPAVTLTFPWPQELRHLVQRQTRDDTTARGDTLLSQKIAAQVPIRVRKMSGDEGEMFFPEYWSFEVESEGAAKVDLDQRGLDTHLLDKHIGTESSQDWANVSWLQPLQAPFALHTDEFVNAQPLIGRLLRSPGEIFALDKRAFQCPGDTTACTSISRPNSCCPNGGTCQIITDTGLGDVGCCGSGQSCGAQVASCADGNTACPGSEGGGCCVPGYSCSGVGCALSSTAITTIQPVVTASPPSSSTPPPTSQSTPPSSTDATTSTSTFTAVTSVISTATSSSFLSSTTSSTPPSSTPRPTTTTSAPAILPVRPTASSIPTITTTAPPTTITASQCPTGFYQCSAYAHPGCCRVGRDCGLTSCPAASSTLAINSNGVTVSVIPSGTGDAALGANGCAVGWFSCANGEGGGCCPSGYACGTSCSATAVVLQNGATGTAEVAKDNGVEALKAGRSMVTAGIGLAIFLLL